MELVVATREGLSLTPQLLEDLLAPWGTVPALSLEWVPTQPAAILDFASAMRLEMKDRLALLRKARSTPLEALAVATFAHRSTTSLPATPTWAGVW